LLLQYEAHNAVTIRCREQARRIDAVAVIGFSGFLGKWCAAAVGDGCAGSATAWPSGFHIEATLECADFKVRRYEKPAQSRRAVQVNRARVPSLKSA